MADSADLAVIAPCFNEGPNVGALVERVGQALSGRGISFELVLVDDGSHDDTWAKICEQATAHPWVKPVRHAKNRGIVESWRSGMLATAAPRLVTIDADLQYRPEDIPTLVEVMDRENVEFVQGWRREQVGRDPLRVFLTSGLSGLLNLLFGTRLRDNKSGFVLYTRAAMTDVLDFSRPFRHFQHFIAIAAHRRGHRIRQVPVVFDERAAGVSFINAPVRFAVSALADIPRALWEFRVGPACRALMKGR